MKSRNLTSVSVLIFVTGLVFGDPATIGRTDATTLKRPNILFLFADDLRHDTIRALGNREIVTPNLDQLVKDGTSFTRAYIMGGTQPAVCVPSRAMLHTGRTLFRCQPLPRGQLFGEVLQRAGYETFGIGKWHNGAATFNWGFANGDSVFFGGMNDHTKVPVHAYDPSGRYAKGHERIGDKFSSELFSDSAVKFLREHPKDPLDKEDRPFFLYLAYTSPHDPRMAPKSYRDMYDDTKLTLPRNFLSEHPFDNGELKVRDEQLAPWPRTQEIVRKHLGDYYAMVTHMDAQIGRVLAALKESGHADDTVVVFAGDNGLAVGQHGLLGKQSVYDHSVHVPLVISGPGIPRGKRNDAMCYLLDLYPTLCELCGIETLPTVEGHSLAAVIRGEQRTVRGTLFFGYRNFQRAVQDGRYKLIEYFPDNGVGARKTQLFDLNTDPWEMKNLAEDPGHAAHVERLRTELSREGKRLDDPLAKPYAF